MSATHRAALAAALLSTLATLAGCDKARPVPGTAAASRCTSCHGGLNDSSGAPPTDTTGRTATSELTVGAHAAHLAAGVTCASCHRVPSVPRDAEVPEHMDGQVQVVFGGVALLGGGTPPSWDAAAGTCSNVYCHGAKLDLGAQGQATTPKWTGLPPTLLPADAQAGTPACGACHGTFATSGAPGGHGAGLGVKDCARCHSGSVTSDGALRPASAGGHHLDGTIDVDSTACTSCHGDPNRAETATRLMAAPPLDTHQQASGAAVGAHLRHVSTAPGLGSRLSRPIDCGECHLVPTVVPHPAGAVVRLEGPLASADNLRPGYSAGTCSNVYCHGATLPGGSSKSPSWTQSYANVTAGAGGECGTCHFAANPPASHPQVDLHDAPITATTQCNQCHAGTVKADGTINLSLGLHVNGLLDVKPHADGWVAATVHGPAAKADLAGCAASACHGGDFSVNVGGGKSCNSCHANPADFGITGAGRHPAWQNECTFCHGDANRSPAAGQDQVGTPLVNAVRAAPPLGSRDETSTAANAVGAHLRHASDDPTAGNRYAAPIRCQECHGLTLPVDVAHVDGSIAIGWQLAATGVTPTPAAGLIPRSGAGAALTCTNYCHGAGWAGNAAYAGSTPAPSWTGAIPAASACGACHRAPPASPAHAAVGPAFNCGNCHTGYACTTGNLAACTVDKASHLNGRLDVASLACNTCHGSATNAAPPRDVAGLASSIRVGAHQAHLTRTTLRSAALGCADCHAVPTSTTHASGTVDMAWGALARTGGLTPAPADLGGAARTAWEAAPTCANYCHGAGFAAAIAGSTTAPRWDGGGTAITCASCHQAPPATAAHTTVTATTDCGSCHAGFTCTTANLAACTVDKATHLNGVVDIPTLGCTSCHGSATNPAPPKDTAGQTSSVKVGAHQAHLVKTNLRSAPIACSDCHTVPSSASHSNGVVDLAWGPLARTGTFTATPGNLDAAAKAAWEASPTCANYCHGAGFAAAVKGSGAAPSWTGPAVATACGSCHQAPPATAFHATVTATTNCGTCHTGYSCTAGNLAACTVNKATHLNGAIDAPSMTCTSCHGTSGVNAAPPAATSTTNAAVKIGAHQAHLGKTNLRSAALGCADCHTIPTSTTHASGTVDMTWGALARTGGLTPTPGNLGGTAWATWEAAPTCANYCHGAGFAATIAGTGTAPSWTGAAVSTACGACHKAPPSTAAHTAVGPATNCGMCHAGYSCTTGNLAACTVNKATHLNGVVDTPTLTCTSCHGSAANAAPPVDTAGASTGVRVGAHQAHLVKANLRAAALACTDCHTVPTSTTHATGAVDMTWGTLARTGALTPTPGSLSGAARTSWEATPTCANYCHGAGFAATIAGNATAPSWTGAAVSTACGACHKAPPATTAHASVGAATDCGSCHTGYACTTANLAACTVNKTLHLNGVVDVPTLSCTSCHGSAANAAPPAATSTTNAAVKVGAHQAHLTKANLRATFLGCADCHTVPSSTSHSSGIVDMTWGALAKTGGLTPTPGNLGPATAPTWATWETAPTCTNYCHGSGFAAASAGSAVIASWTGTAVNTACGTCHKAPPTTADHSTVTSSTNCGNCHTGYSCTTANLAACTVNKALHLNGVVDAPVLGCTTCHGSAANAAPPAATSTTNAAVKVGAHQAHLTKVNLRATALGCADCHTVPSSTSHSTGIVDMTWGALAKTGGLTPTPGNLGPATSPTWATWEATPTCTNYCHGSGFAAAVKGSGATPSWTGAAVATACGSCHQAPPATADHSTVTSSTNCGTCHTGYSCTTANLATCTVNTALHLNGAIDAPSMTCTSCHGSAANAAPPAATSTTNAAVKVGAHQAHLTKSNLRNALLGCADCHTVPSSTSHSTGIVDMTWGALAKTGGLTPTPGNLGPATAPTWATWEATPTCTNYCHGAGFAAAVKGSGAAPSWTGAAVNTACGSCHQAPPATASHSGVTATTDCGGCHTGYACTTANLAACTVNKTLHLNGVIDAPSLSCTSCHGTSGVNAAPPAATSTTNAAVKIGAHQAHLTKANLRTAALGCADCHTVPSSTSHSSGTVDMTWGALAKTGGLTPTPGNLGPATAPTWATWEATPTCTNYCHGAGFDAAHAGSATAPSWTGAAVNTACGSCHKAPPSSAGHSTVTSTTNCGACHAGYSCTTANLAACTVDKATHLNGALDVSALSCSSCHGSATNNAPPAATSTTNATVKVGAHQAHLTGTTLRTAALGCADCHTVPTSTSHSSGVVDMTWGALARTGAVTPSPANLGPATAPTQAAWEASPTCANYCHGATLVGGTLTAPSWSGTSTASACTACHGAPPSYATAMSGGRGVHPPNATCATCHPGSTATVPAKATHLNGVVEVVALTCHSCHGSATNNAPPTDTTGGTAAARVGAHQAHVVGKTYSDGLGGNSSCTECHGALPTANTHASGATNLAWGTVALTTGAATPAAGAIVPGSAVTCTNYCHNVKTSSGGATGGSVASIAWTGAITACNACHAIPSTGGRHTSVGEHRTTCNVCHPAAYTSTTVDKALHVNGVRNVTATGWSAASRSCGNNGSGCHGSGTKGPW